MIKILVDYDISTGEIKDGNVYITTYAGLDHLKHKDEDKKNKRRRVNSPEKGRV